VSKKAESLLSLAEKDLAHAADNARKHPRHAAFSVQQAAEKLIKSVLEKEGVSYPSVSHQLDDLIARVPPSNPFRGDLVPLARLTSAATKYRYPTARGDVPADPPMSEIQEDMATVKALLPEVRDWVREGG
jgi:HEPN domain-containing protein